MAEGLFSESDGEWNPIVGFKDRYYAGYSARDAYTEPLLWKHPAFKRQLVRLLNDLTAAGTLTAIDEESFVISITNGWTDSMTNPSWRGTLPKAGTKVEMRTCDFHALHAAKQADGLAFNPFSDVEARNEVLKKLRSYYSK